jgi:5-methylcytosine-specific restriction endonuclease McrA
VRHFKHSDVCECGNVKKRSNKYCTECIDKRVYQKPTLEAAKSGKYRRQYLIETRGYRCEECGVSEWRGQRLPLELHHIDGDSDHNSEENLVLLCPNCHAIKPTHKRRNALKNGKRQQMRRQRYADGKTW